MTTPDTELDELAPLAADTDVAETLGVSEVSMLPAHMTVRMDKMLRRVSRRFRFEAQRIFTPGTYTMTDRIHAGAIRLPELIDSVIGIKIQGVEQATWALDSFPALGIVESDMEDSEFTDMPGGLGQTANDLVPQGPKFSVVGNWIYWDDWDFWALNGRQVRVSFVSKTAVPQDVIDSVAAIAARNLTVNPMSAVPQSKSLSTRHYRQQVSDWASDGNVGFTDSDIAQARSYRYPAPPLIVANYSVVDTSPSPFFMSDSSW